jgi:hypothetical protein
MTEVVILRGGHITDTVFTLSDCFRGEEITWNVTKLQDAADRGEFERIKLALDLVPPPNWESGNLDRERVDGIKNTPHALALPAIVIENEPGYPHKYLCFCDGQHRITARQELGLGDFEAFVVPHDVEKRFRVIEQRVTLT